MNLHPDVERVLYSEEEIKARVRTLGEQITQDYAGSSLVVVSILRGAAIFTCDLVREINLPVEMDFMVVSSYGNSTTSSGSIKILKDLSTNIEGRHVLIVEDILDSGLTLHHLSEYLSTFNPASVTIATLFRKKTPNQLDVKATYVGFECEDEFIVGYGLDYAQRYRNLPYIGILKKEIYSV